MRIALLALSVLIYIVPAAAQGPDASQAAAIRAASGPGPQLHDPLRSGVHAGETTLDDQTGVALTAYNNDRALVRDRRTLKLLPGEVYLRFTDVAARIMPETVSLKSLSHPGELTILEQNYEYDLMGQQALMEKYVGRDIRLVNKSSEFTFYELHATLLSNNDGPIYQIGGDIYLGHPGSVVLPEIPEELIAKPSLIWLLDNDGTDHDVEVSYLTGGVSWNADYVVRLAPDEESVSVEGWVTLTNESGATYANAQLKLVAGDVNLVQPEIALGRGGGFGGRALRAPMPVEETFAEYHLYSMPRRTTIKQNQTKQLSLLRVDGAAVTKAYEFRGREHYYMQPTPAASEHVGVYLELKNTEQNRMGMPLPAGVMRVYQEDSEGMLQFSGEDRIKHTPKDEAVRLRLGNAFDVVGERSQTDFRRVSGNVHESSYTIVLRNHKDEAITVDVVEPIPGDWTVLESSHTHVKNDAKTAVFSIPIPAGAEAELAYRIRVVQ